MCAVRKSKMNALYFGPNVEKSSGCSSTVVFACCCPLSWYTNGRNAAAGSLCNAAYTLDPCMILATALVVVMLLLLLLLLLVVLVLLHGVALALPMSAEYGIPK